MAEGLIRHEAKPWFLSLLGSAPVAEAIELGLLCRTASQDLGVLREFESTINAYSNPNTSAVTKRIEERFSSDKSDKLGAIISVGSENVGMA
ncbi:MAG: hypothetical protein ABI354_03290, partial [Candidatus Saccharimonadales bacterium]